MKGLEENTTLDRLNEEEVDHDDLLCRTIVSCRGRVKYDMLCVVTGNAEEEAYLARLFHHPFRVFSLTDTLLDL